MVVLMETYTTTGTPESLTQVYERKKKRKDLKKEAQMEALKGLSR
jgi:hypothetical protein